MAGSGKMVRSNRKGVSRRLKLSTEVSFSLWWYAKIIFSDPDTIWVFGEYFGVFGGGTRLAMSKTILRVGLIVIEAWFRGY